LGLFFTLNDKKKNKMKNLLLILILFIALLTSCNKVEVGPTSPCTSDFPDSSLKHPKAQDYQALLDEYVNKGLPGIILLIKDNDGLFIGCAGKADIDEDIDMMPCTVSKVASLTKLMISTLTLKLVEEGVLDLDKKISTWLPEEIISKIENADESTLRQLLNHTSGIYDVVEDQGFYLNLLNNPAKHWTGKELLEFVYNKPAYFPCGTDIYYSNSNFLLISLIIDYATGKDHATLLKEKVFDKAGLNHTYYFWHQALPENTAQGYYDLYNNNTLLNLTNWNTGSGNGYGGTYSNVYDLMKFIQALFVDKTLINQASLDQMMTWGKEETGTKRLIGLGCYKDFIKRDSSEYGIGHRGRDLAYSADADYFPKNGTIMTMLVNYGTDGASPLGDIFYEFRDKVVDIIFD